MLKIIDSDWRAVNYSLLNSNVKYMSSRSQDKFDIISLTHLITKALKILHQIMIINKTSPFRLTDYLNLKYPNIKIFYD